MKAIRALDPWTRYFWKICSNSFQMILCIVCLILSRSLSVYCSCCQFHFDSYWKYSLFLYLKHFPLSSNMSFIDYFSESKVSVLILSKYLCTKFYWAVFSYVLFLRLSLFYFAFFLHSGIPLKSIFLIGPSFFRSL